MKIDFLFQGVSDKLGTIKKFCFDNDVDINTVAFVGDDLNDFEQHQERLHL